MPSAVKPTWVSDDGLFVGRIEVTPSYDYRDLPNDQRGAGGAKLHFVLTCPQGVMVGTVATGWMLRPLSGPYARGGGKQQRQEKVGVDPGSRDYYPSGSYVGIHSAVPVYDWWQGPDKCEWLDGPCWGDGGYLVADHMLERLVADGHAGAFQFLRECYESWTYQPDAEDAGGAS